MKLNKFIAASLCAGLFFTGCGPNSNTSSPSDSGESEHVDYEDLYDDVIALYKESIEKNDPQLVKSRFDTISESEIDEMTKPCELPVSDDFWDEDDPEYAIEDVTGDDVPELLIGSQGDYHLEPNIYSIYGIIDGEVRSLFQTYSESFLMGNTSVIGLDQEAALNWNGIGIRGDHSIFYKYYYGAEGVGFKSYKIIFNPLEPQIMEHFEECFDANSFKQVARVKTEDGEIETITHEEFNEKLDEYSALKDYSWHSF